MSLRLNQNIQFLSPDKLERPAPVLKKEVIEQLNQAQKHAGSELILETRDGFVKSVDLKAFLEKPEQYSNTARAFFSIEVGGKTVVVELAKLTKDNILGALDRALGRLETTGLQGVASSDFLHSVSGLVAQIRGGGPQPVIEEDKSKSYTLDPTLAGTKPPAAALDQRTARALDTAMDLSDAGPKQDPVARKAKIIETTLQALGGEAYKKLPQPQQQALQKLLGNFSLKELRAVEVQGFGGAESGDGITGSGAEGHYTNSLLSSVRQLLLTGRVNAEVLESLNRLQQAPLAPELASQRLGLVRSTLQDIAFPEKINQHAKGTCAAASVQILFAIKDPARYVAVVSELASPTGKVPKDLLRDKGDQLFRVAGTLSDDGSGRSVSGRLLQPALMEYGDGKNLHYNNEKDQHSDKEGGLGDSQTNHLLEGLFGKKSYTTIQAGKHPEKLIAQLEQVLATGQPVTAGARWGDGAHEILITGIDKAKDKVFFVNPWGEAESISLREFQMQVDAINVPSGKHTGGDPMQALKSLPGALKDTSNYKPLDTERYRTLETLFVVDPGLAALPKGQKDKLLAAFKRLKLDDYQAHLSTLAKGGGKYIDEMLKAIAPATDRWGGGKQVGLFTALQKAEDAHQITPARARQILDSPVREHLKLTDYLALLAAIKAQPVDQAKIDGFLKLAETGKKNQTDLDQKLKQLGVKPATQKKAKALIQASAFGDQLLGRLQALNDKKAIERAVVLYSKLQSIALNSEAVLCNQKLIEQLIALKPEEQFSPARFKGLLKALADDDLPGLKALMELYKPAQAAK